MAHDGLAKAWAELQRRIDISNIVYEILGHFDLSSVGTSPSAAQSFSFIVWMKVIYDLQRTYLQSLEHSVESTSYLLPPRILFTTIYYVLEKVTQLFLQPWREDGNLKIAQREFAAQALLSGLRALQLRGNFKVSFTTEEIEKAHSLLQKWLWEIDGPGNTEPERFMLLKCKTALLRICHGPELDSIWHLPANGSCKLSDERNLYVAWPSDATVAFETQLECLRAGSEDSFWALFDIIWAAEASCIQWFVDGLLGDNILEKDSQVRILVGMIEDMAPEFPEIACSTVLKKTWNDSLNSGPRTSVAFVSRVETSLTAFQTFLQNRRTTLVDYNLEIRKLSTGLREKIESWIRQESGYKANENLRGEGQQPLETAYVLRCPHLHVIPESEMRSLVEGTKHQHIFTSPKLLNLEKLEVHCPRCTSIQVVRHARMIEPLQYMSDRLSDLLEDSITLRQLKVPSPQDSPQFSQPPLFPKPFRERQDSGTVHPLIAAQYSWNRGALAYPIVEPPLPRTPPPDSPPQKSPSKGSTESNSITSTYAASVHEKKGFFKKIRSSTFGRRPDENPLKIDEVSIPKVEVGSVFKSYCFSTDGKTLILWDPKTSYVYASTIPANDGHESGSMWSWSKLSVPRVRLVTGGGSNVAAILKDKSTFKLQVFTTPADLNTKPIFDRNLGKDQFQSLTTSIKGNLVAVGTERRVYVFDVTNPTDEGKKFSVKHPDKVDFDSQRVAFSRNGGQVVVATRWSDGQTEIILYDLEKSLKAWSKSTVADGIADQDHGVSALFYDTEKEKVVMTVYTSKDYNIVHSKDVASIPWKKRNGKLQAAVACSSGPKYLLLSATGSLHTLDLGQQAPLGSRLGWKLRYRPGSAAQFIALATPENDCIYAFWVESDKMKLEVIRGDNEPVPKVFRGPPL